MALKEFKDYPNTETPIDVENLNNNFSELDQKIDDEVTNNTQINAGSKTVATGIDFSKHTLIKIEGIAKFSTIILRLHFLLPIHQH